MLASAYDPDPAALPGAWTCVAGACPDEAIAFTRDESRLIDRSWLLDRPALMNCRWTLTGQRQHIDDGTGGDYACDSLEVSLRELRLHKVGGDAAVFRRASD